MKEKKARNGRIEKCVFACGLAVFVLISTILGTSVLQGAVTEKTEISNPVIEKASNLEAGQKVTWDCVWFGTYPQTEVVSTDAEYTALTELTDADWNTNGDTELNGKKYRRIKKADATLAVDGKDSYYSWSDETTYHYFRFEPIKWRVLNVGETQLLLLSDVALDAQKYSTTVGNITWKKSNLRSWLNGYAATNNTAGVDYSADNFISVAFTEEEQATIADTTVVNRDNFAYGRNGGADTTDKLFLLSESEVYTGSAKTYGFVSNFLTNDEARQSKSSDYAKAMGVWSYTNTGYVDNCNWLLRSPGGENSVTYINHYGYVDNLGCYVHDGGNGIRVALNLTLTDSTMKLYAGTVCSNGTVSEIAPSISEEVTTTEESSTTENTITEESPTTENTTTEESSTAENVTTEESSTSENVVTEEKTTIENETTEEVSTTEKQAAEEASTTEKITSEEETTDKVPEEETTTQEIPSTPVVNAQTPVIEQEPADRMYSYGNKAYTIKYKVAVSDGGTLSYQWYVRNSRTGTPRKIEGATMKEYRPSTASVGVKFYSCVITNTNQNATGSKTASIETRILKLTVRKAYNRITGVSAFYGKTVGQSSFTLKAQAKGSIYYASSNTKVAKVDAKSGKVTICGVGSAYITIKAGNAYYRNVEKRIRIRVNPKKQSIVSLASPSKKAMRIKWNQHTGITGYKIKYAMNKDFKGAKYVTVTESNRNSKTIYGLTSGKTYYVKIRTYRRINTRDYMGEWSSTKTCKIR